MRIKKMLLKRSLILSISAGLILFLLDVFDVLINKSYLFYDFNQRLLFFWLFAGVALIFALTLGLAQAFLLKILSKLPITIKKILFLHIILFAVYFGLEYGTYFSKERILGILFLCAVSGYVFIHVLIKDLEWITKSKKVKLNSMKLITIFLIFSSLYWINSRLFFNQNFILHLSMVWVMFFLLQIMLAYIFKNRILDLKIRNRFINGAAVFCLVALIIFPLFNIERSQNIKRISFDQTSIERFMLYTIKRIFDFDQDKYTYILGGGDPDDFNSHINPQASEISNNDIDENGFGGDHKPGSNPPALFIDSFNHPDKSFLKNTKGEFNIVILIVDALRPDHMGCYGYSRNTTPFIDQLAKNAFVFENAYAQACHTRTSMPSFMLSQYQPFAGKKWQHKGKTLAEIFKENGFHTISILFYKLGEIFARGYDDFGVPEINPKKWNIKDPFLSMAIDMIDKVKENRFFAWIHLPYPHHPYSLHENSPVFGYSDKDIYDNEIHYSDNLIREFFKELENRELLDKTIFVIMSDHGEEFKEHGAKYHNSTTYNEQIHVPLILKIPDREGRRIEENVQLIDLSVTLLNLSGSKRENYHLGRSLIPLIDGKDEYWHNQALSGPIGSFQKFALINDNWKIIYNMRNNFYELYNLEEDPYEQHNLIDIDSLRNAYGTELIQNLHHLIEFNNTIVED